MKQAGKKGKDRPEREWKNKLGELTKKRAKEWKEAIKFAKDKKEKRYVVGLNS